MLNVRVTSKNFALVLKSAETLPERIDAAAGRGLAAGLEYTVETARNEFLSGPRPVHLVTQSGRLRDSITSAVEKMSGGWRGRIGTVVPYGAFWEFGFHDIENVRAHVRVPRVFSLLTGKKIELRKSFLGAQNQFLGFKENTSRALRRHRAETIFAPQQQVRAHKRQVDQDPRPFIRPALEQNLPVIQRAIETELAKVS